MCPKRQLIGFYARNMPLRLAPRLRNSVWLVSRLCPSAPNPGGGLSLTCVDRISGTLVSGAEES